ncbi:copper resistance protein CopC [Brevundimonas sp.]|uniref:copper resistance protein CopC n=1 Tax=Brevundimonas sp. TaxID=1871086 RepID=UPI002737AE64|nr:copper resistance protein CopC [Brevundimonas sp.]MDP3801909.1 copper resistance protein CopC [Brevundimonas sp.]
MNRSTLAGLVALAVLTPSVARAQDHSHAGMSPQDHAAMQAAPAATGVTTTPADNAMLAAAPAAFSVTFPHAMTLTSLRLTGPQTVEVAVSADAAPATTVSAPLPALAPGSWSAAWTARGADGHEMSGVVRFMVH